MARKRRPRLVASFSSTFSAMRAEEACREAGVAGRLIPTPVAISAECGLAWSMAPSDRDAFVALNVDYDALTPLDL